MNCCGQGFSFRDLAFVGNADKPAAGSDEIPGLFVDSVAGNDSTGNGTSNAPFASLAKVTTTIGSSLAATNIYLKRGSVFRESFAIPTNSTVDCYGVATATPAGITNANWPAFLSMAYTNSKPIISGATNLANASFTLTSGKTNTYQIGIAVPRDTNLVTSAISTNVMMVWQNNLRMGKKWDKNAGYNATPATAIASVDVTTNCFYFDGANNTLYINTGLNGDPATNGMCYEASIRQLAVYGGSNFLVQNIRAEKAYNKDGGGQSGYQILGNLGGTYRYCQAVGSWNHAMGFANDHITNQTAVIDSCFISDCEYQNDNTPTLAIGYGDYNSNFNIIWTNTMTYQSYNGGSNLNSGGSYQLAGFYTHNSGHVGASNYYANCYSYGSYYGLLAGADSQNVSSFTSYECGQGVQIGNPTTITNVQFSNLTNYNAKFYGVKVANNCPGISVVNSYFLSTNIASYNFLALGNQPIAVTNCIFAATTNGYGVGVYAAGTAHLITLTSNSFYKGFDCISAGSITNASTAGVINSDRNNYYGWGRRIGTDVIAPAGNFTTLTAWKSACNPSEQNSTQTDPGYTSIFNYTLVDPSGQ